jgi:hypothetical protein
MLTQEIPEKDWTPWQRDVMRGWKRRAIRDRQELRIAEWIERQKRSHDWVCLADMADCCARRPGDIERDSRRRVQAYCHLQESILQGEFHEDGRLRVIYLPSLPPLPHALKLRLDAAQFRIWLRPGTVLSQVLALCWVPQRLCIRWFKARRIDAPPWLASTPTHAEPVRTPDGSILGTRMTPSSALRASEHQIHDAIANIYSEHATAGKKPPNVKELVPLVKAELRENGFDATYARIELCGADSRHAAKRRRPGRTVRSELMSLRARGQVS